MSRVRPTHFYKVRVLNFLSTNKHYLLFIPFFIYVLSLLLYLVTGRSPLVLGLIRSNATTP